MGEILRRGPSRACEALHTGAGKFAGAVRSAREEALQNARILMAAAGAVRNYTANDLARLLPVVVDGKFVPETISAYAAQRNLRELLTPFDGFTYREPTLNPTNLSDRAQDWEADIINILRAQPARREVVIERDTPTGRTLHMARPITVHEQASSPSLRWC